MNNKYEPDNVLQKLWDSASGGYCLCTMRESCSNCSFEAMNSRREQQKLIKEAAKAQNYQLWRKLWGSKEYAKVQYEDV